MRDERRVLGRRSDPLRDSLRYWKAALALSLLFISIIHHPDDWVPSIARRVVLYVLGLT